VIASFSPLPSVISSLNPSQGFGPGRPPFELFLCRQPTASLATLKRQIAEMDRLGSLYKPGSLVFANESGRAINPSNLRNRSFARLLMRARLPAATSWHVLGEACDGEQ
jgi:hypothetical protein